MLPNDWNAIGINSATDWRETPESGFWRKWNFAKFYEIQTKAWSPSSSHRRASISKPWSVMVCRSWMDKWKTNVLSLCFSQIHCWPMTEPELWQRWQSTYNHQPFLIQAMAGCIHECNPVYECTVNWGWLYLIVFLAWLKYFWGTLSKCVLRLH